MKTQVLVAALAAVGMVGGANAALLDLDFTSDGSGDATPFGAGAPLGTAGGFTEMAVAELGPSNNVSTDPSITVGAITFAITGNVSAWPGNDGGGDPVLGDYLFFHPSGALGADPVITWTVSGLAANTAFNLDFAIGENEPTVRGVTYDAQGQQLALGNGGAVDGTLTLTSDGSGVITGTATATGNEANWASFSVSDVPEPGSLALLGLGGLTLLRRRRA